MVATGVPCGIMDQLASLAGSRDRALLIDCRSFEIEPIPLPPRLAVLVIHSGMSRQLVDSAYAERRRAVRGGRRAARPVRHCATRRPSRSPTSRAPATSSPRTHACSRRPRRSPRGDLATLGRLLAASHASLRDDFEVSTPELDVLVEELVEAGALGARLTGAGFGGCVVGLAEP